MRIQSGYRKNFSTQTALLKMIDDIRFAIDQKKITILVMIDFSLAFNSIKWQPILELCSLANFSDDAILFLYS